MRLGVYRVYRVEDYVGGLGSALSLGFRVSGFSGLGSRAFRVEGSRV